MASSNPCFRKWIHRVHSSDIVVPPYVLPDKWYNEDAHYCINVWQFHLQNCFALTVHTVYLKELTLPHIFLYVTVGIFGLGERTISLAVFNREGDISKFSSMSPPLLWRCLKTDLNLQVTYFMCALLSTPYTIYSSGIRIRIRVPTVFF